MVELKTRNEIIEICLRLHRRNMLAACDGNVSVKISNNEILITPSGVAKAFIQPEEIAVVSLEGEVISGQPSGEIQMHLEVYRRCEKAKAVVHAHPPHAIAWSIAKPELKELPAHGISEVILATGSIPIVPYARATTIQMAQHLSHFLPQHRVLILARHGAITWGESLKEAWIGMERLEHSAQILQIAHSLGGITNLPSDEVEALKAMRTQFGDRNL